MFVEAGGGPAFPVLGDQRLKEINTGMTLRDWFAGFAIKKVQCHLTYLEGPTQNMDIERIAKTAYLLADGIILERSRMLKKEEDR